MACCLSSQCAPAYTCSPPAPPYSVEPQPSEKRIGFSPRHSGRPLPTGTVSINHKHASIVFENQECGSKTPSFGTNSRVKGELSAHNRDGISKIVVKIEGTIQLANTVNGLRKQTVCQSHTLFQTSHGEICPGEIPFCIPFPNTYQDDGHEYSLPPSFSIGLDAVSVLHAKSQYTISFTIFRHNWRSLFTSKTIRIPVNYKPRSRPPRAPIFSHLLPSVKVEPDEWMQVSSQIDVRDTSALQPLQSHLFIPSVQIFTLSKSIPFHVQVCGPCVSIRELFGSRNEEPVVSVRLIRQVIVDMMGEKSWRNVVVGEGAVRALPPPLSCKSDEENCSCDTVSLDWEGEVHSSPDVTVGGFNGGSLIVRDFLQLTITPASSKSSQMLPFTTRRVIRLVTDPFEEEPEEYLESWM